MKNRLLRQLALVVVGLVLGGGALAAGGASDGITAARFSLVIDSYEIASFSELKSISMVVVPTEYLSSDDKSNVLHHLPAVLTAPSVTLSGPMTQNLALNAWHDFVRRGLPDNGRKSASLIFYTNQGAPVARYWLEGAWPSKIEITAPAKSGDPLIQTVTLVGEYMQRVAP